MIQHQNPGFFFVFHFFQICFLQNISWHTTHHFSFFLKSSSFIYNYILGVMYICPIFSDRVLHLHNIHVYLKMCWLSISKYIHPILNATDFFSYPYFDDFTEIELYEHTIFCYSENNFIVYMYSKFFFYIFV